MDDVALQDLEQVVSELTALVARAHEPRGHRCWEEELQQLQAAQRAGDLLVQALQRQTETLRPRP